MKKLGTFVGAPLLALLLSGNIFAAPLQPAAAMAPTRWHPQ